MLNFVDDVPVFGDPIDQAALDQIKRCREDAAYVCLMGDHHKGYNMPIGGVAAYADKIAPSGVGFDIACGNKAVRLDVTYDEIKGDLSKIADEMWSQLSFGMGRNNNEEVEDPLFDDPIWHEIPLFQNDRGIKQIARNQLGTIGGGNHYADVFRDEMGNVWIGVHFGSRGLGHKIATEYIKLSGQNPNGSMDDKPMLLDARNVEGQQYLEGMELAGKYAYAGRSWVCSKIASIIGAKIVEEVHNHHNFAWKEKHFGEDLWVIRKGATPALPGQKGFVGGSMGDNSVILEGVASEESAQVMYSTVHGAGRVMSRTRAAGKMRRQGGKTIRISEGEVNMDAVRKRIAGHGIHLRGAGADEAPEVYKRLPEVLRHHEKTVQVLHNLEPLIVCMASAEELDPYKD